MKNSHGGQETATLPVRLRRTSLSYKLRPTGGGACNCVPQGTLDTIIGGAYNISNGLMSAILGGDHNDDRTFDFAGIYGFSINARANRAFHASNYVVDSMPVAGAGAPNQMYYRVAGTVCPVFI